MRFLACVVFPDHPLDVPIQCNATGSSWPWPADTVTDVNDKATSAPANTTPNTTASVPTMTLESEKSFPSKTF